MIKKRHKEHYELPEIDMTPLIDAVFQLVIFFILIMSVDQVFGVAIKFPMGGQAKAPVEKKLKQVKPISVWVGPDNYTVGHRVLAEGIIKLNGQPIGLGSAKDSATAAKQHQQGMDYLYQQIRYLTHAKDATYDTVMMVSGEVNSYHGRVVEVVDQGKKAELKSFSLLPPQSR